MTSLLVLSLSFMGGFEESDSASALLKKLDIGLGTGTASLDFLLYLGGTSLLL